MAKTVIGLLIGIAVKDGAIRSIDDPAEVYAPGLKDTEYGRTPIRALLQMASGVAFSQVCSNRGSDIYQFSGLTLQHEDPIGSVAALRKFNVRLAPPGQRFSYASADSLMLGVVLAGAVKRPVVDYARDRLWAPLGAEADASWAIDATGQEITYAHSRQRRGPRDWVIASSLGARRYGYQTRLLPTRHRSFELRGIRGQHVMVDLARRLVWCRRRCTALAILSRSSMLYGQR